MLIQKQSTRAKRQRAASRCACARPPYTSVCWCFVLFTRLRRLLRRMLGTAGACAMSSLLPSRTSDPPAETCTSGENKSKFKPTSAARESEPPIRVYDP
eukprot:1915159-Pleurochrysis_carterae.AAC.1